MVTSYQKVGPQNTTNRTAKRKLVYLCGKVYWLKEILIQKN